MDRIKENEIYDKFQDLCNSHKEISHFGNNHICNTECPLRDTNRCENVFFYQQGRVDGAKEFAEWLQANVFIDTESGVTVVCGKEFTRIVSFWELYAEWQKGKE